MTKHITKISENHDGMRGVHVIGSWGGGGWRKIRMVCKECGSFFEPLWDYDYVVDRYVDFDFVEIDPG